MSQSRNQQFESPIKDFFAELNPALEAAQKLDREMNQIFAHRFNVLDYVHTKELGLSRIIADLFDPNASHGQGTFFIKSLLTRLKKERSCAVDEKWLDFDNKDVHVRLEKTIKADRRIDIYVTIKSKSRNTYCLAIENKPYADDRKNQVADYLEHLKQYEKNFLLIYLSSRGQKPSQKSLPESRYPKPENQKDDWKCPFKTMAYYNEPGITEMESDSTEAEKTKKQISNSRADDECEDYHISFSLADWLSECRKNCEVDRLRSFLLDAKNFCMKQFGDSLMVEDYQKKAIEEIVFSNPESNIDSAKIIAKSWPQIQDEICHKFFLHLCKEIEYRLKKEIGEEIVLKTLGNEGRSGKMTQVNVYREDWANSIGEGTKRIRIALESGYRGPNGWFIGIKIKNFSQDRDKYDDLLNRICAEEKIGLDKNMHHDWYPLRFSFDEHSNWHLVLPNLRNECGALGGEVTSYYVNNFIRLAEKAIPCINEFEKIYALSEQ